MNELDTLKSDIELVQQRMDERSKNIDILHEKLRALQSEQNEDRATLIHLQGEQGRLLQSIADETDYDSINRGGMRSHDRGMMA